MAVLLVPHNTLTLYLKFNIPPSLVPPAPNHPPPLQPLKNSKEHSCLNIGTIHALSLSSRN